MPRARAVRAITSCCLCGLVPAGGITRTLRNCLPLDATAIDEALSTRYTEHIQHLSQVEHGTGSRIGLYFTVVGTHALGVVPSFYSCRLSHGVLVRFLRFRLGCHHLRIHTGRWQLPALLRPQRTCLRCSSTAVDDEAHCLFLCEHPTIVEARDVFLSAVVLYHLCPHCRLSGMLTFGHCIQLAGSLFQCWSSMLPSAFVSVDNATSLVVLMWWTCQTSCFRKISI